MPNPDWDQRYATQELPWDSGRPDAHLVEYLERGPLRLARGRALEVGCGTGTNVLWLAKQGFEVLGVDVSPRAIAQASAKLEQADEAASSRARLAVLDFLDDPLDEPPFDLVFDRGVLHVFDEAASRARFAERVSRLLGPDGYWLSILGSTEGPERDHGPPRRSAREIVEALEPVLEIVELRASSWDSVDATAWLMLSRTREVPAQPSTTREG